MTPEKETKLSVATPPGTLMQMLGIPVVERTVSRDERYQTDIPDRKVMVADGLGLILADGLQIDRFATAPWHCRACGCAKTADDWKVWLPRGSEHDRAKLAEVAEAVGMTTRMTHVTTRDAVCLDCAPKARPGKRIGILGLLFRRAPR